jgi:integrase
MGYARMQDRKGKVWYSFLIYDTKTKKNVKLKKSDIRNRFGKDVTTEIEAENVMKLLRAEYDSVKERYKKRLEWKEKYFNFASLLDSYEKRQKKKAPYGYKNSVHYLKYYVLPYFLNIIENNNIHGWYLDYPKFRYWLEDEAKLLQKPTQNISYASKNHAIKALNTFMRHLKEESIVTELHVCEAFHDSKLNERTIDDVITEDEYNSVYERLKLNGDNNEAEFFSMLYWTGMRFNEAIGISLADIYKGDISRDSFKNLLWRNRIYFGDEVNDMENYLYRYFGFFTLSSQPDNNGSRNITRDSNGKIDRKPLKSKKVINERNTRVVPIINDDLWLNLSRRARKAHNDWSKRILITNDKASYLLFEGVNKTTTTNKLKRAFSEVGLRYRTWHCCRHSRGTFLYGKTGDKQLSKAWLGHSSDKVHDKYLHTYEALLREIKNNETNWGEE